MKKKLIALALIIIVALAAMEGLYLLFRRAHAARQTEPVAALAPIAEVRPEASAAPQQTESFSGSVAHAMKEVMNPPKPEDEIPRHQSFDELPEEIQQEFETRRQDSMDELYSKRFDIPLETWKAMTPEEQRIRISKGTRK